MATINEQGQQVAFGMPAPARLRVTSSRALPTLGGLDIAGHVSDYPSATVRDAVVTDAFWGTPAWSPPRW